MRSKVKMIGGEGSDDHCGAFVILTRFRMLRIAVVVMVVVML